MLIVALVIVLAPLAWLVIKQMQHADPAVRAQRIAWVLAGLGAALALRVALAAPVLLKVALGLLAIAALALWLRGRGQGGGGPGGGDPPVDPPLDPSPGHHVEPRRDGLDPEALDRARAEWEQALKKHASD